MDFAKQNWHEREELTPEDENVGSREELSRSRSRKVILPNKANSSVSSRNRDTSMRCDHLFSEEANSSSSSRNHDTSIRHNDPFSKQNWHERKERSSPKMKMCDQEGRQENTAELGNDAELDSKTKLDERT